MSVIVKAVRLFNLRYLLFFSSLFNSLSFTLVFTLLLSLMSAVSAAAFLFVNISLNDFVFLFYQVWKRNQQKQLSPNTFINFLCRVLSAFKPIGVHYFTENILCYAVRFQDFCALFEVVRKGMLYSVQ